MEELKKEKIKNIFYVRDENSNKGDFGYVGIIGGCIEYSGAVKLANLSCSSLTAGCRSCKGDSTKRNRKKCITLSVRTNVIYNRF